MHAVCERDLCRVVENRQGLFQRHAKSLEALRAGLPRIITGYERLNARPLAVLETEAAGFMLLFYKQNV